MQLIDSHTHIYGEEFDEDRDEMLARATEAGVGQMVLPNVDAASYPRVLELCAAHPKRLFPTIGLHPTYVKEDYISQLDYMEGELSQRPHVAIGTRPISGSRSKPSSASSTGLLSLTSP